MSGSDTISSRFANTFLDTSTATESADRSVTHDKPVTFLEERTIGPELGQDSINAGKLAAYVGMAAVVCYMIASYGFFPLHS